MQYDPVKNIFNRLIKNNRFFRKIFFYTLDLLILRQWYVKKEIKKYLSKEKKNVFFDAGAGFCQYSDYILEKYPMARVFAVDLKTDYLRDYYQSLSEGKKKKFSFSEGDLQNFEIQKGKADIVIAVDILEHIVDDSSVLKNFYSSMNHGAFLIISTPSNLDKAAAYTEEHVRPGYSILELKEKVKQQGFQEVSCKYSYGFWGKLYWHLIMKNSLTLIAVSKLFFIILPVYLLVVFIPALIFMILDIISYNRFGNGIILVAKK